MPGASKDSAGTLSSKQPKFKNIPILKLGKTCVL